MNIPFDISSGKVITHSTQGFCGRSDFMRDCTTIHNDIKLYIPFGCVVDTEDVDSHINEGRHRLPINHRNGKPWIALGVFHRQRKRRHARTVVEDIVLVHLASMSLE